MVQSKGGKEFLQTEDGFQVFDGIVGSPRYYQKMKFDLIAKMEQIGPVQIFYTLSCPNKRWSAILAGILQNTRPDLLVLSSQQEKDNNLAEKSASKEKENFEYRDEDEVEEEEDNIEVFKLNKEKENYFIHEEQNLAENCPAEEKCHLHSNCRRKKLENFLDKTTANKLQAEHVLDITRNFNRRAKIFRRTILTSKSSPLKIRYYQDRVEFQARGHPHIHGMGWSDMEELDKNLEGIKDTFQKLKQRERLSVQDIRPLQQFIDSSVTCTTNQDEIKGMIQPRKKGIKGKLSGETKCQAECDPNNCESCAELYSKLIRERVLDVQVHNHTFTCRKNEKSCRFGIPRTPSYYTLIAQPLPEEVRKQERDTVAGANFVMKKIEIHLKGLERQLKDQQKENKEAEITESLEEILRECLADIRISDNEEAIVIREGDKEHVFKTYLVQDSWKQNPRHKEYPISLLATRDSLRASIYHFALSLGSHGAKVILKRNPKDILINNFNPHWMLFWNGNMDLQICLDYFSIITYMTDYM